MLLTQLWTVACYQLLALLLHLLFQYADDMIILQSLSTDSMLMKLAVLQTFIEA
jgi:hypothetical protein